MQQIHPANIQFNTDFPTHHNMLLSCLPFFVITANYRNISIGQTDVVSPLRRQVPTSNQRRKQVIFDSCINVGFRCGSDII